MNNSLVISLIIFLTYWNIIGANIPKSKDLADIVLEIITQKLEEIREEIPQNVGELSIRKNNYLFRNLTVSYLHLSGIKNYNATELKNKHDSTPNMKHEIGFLIENAEFYMDYDPDWLGYDGIEIFNNSGQSNLNLRDIYIEGHETLSLKPLIVRNIDAVLTLKSNQFHQELNSHISDGLTEYLAKIINEYQHDISPLLSIIVEFIITRIILYKS